MEKLVDIVHFLHLEISNAFGNAGLYPLKAIRLCLLHLICNAVVVPVYVLTIKY